jgi:hypothetical protein
MTPPRSELSPRPGRVEPAIASQLATTPLRHSPTAATRSSSSQPSGSDEASALPDEELRPVLPVTGLHAQGGR